MNASPSTLVAEAPAFWRGDRKFYVTSGVLLVLLLLATFARTYFLRGYFGLPPLSVRLHIHGAVMTTWVALFFTQTCLVAARRVDIHRALGIFGAFVAALVVVMGTTTTVHAAAREVQAHSVEAVSRVMVMGLEVMQMVLFAALVGTALWLRRRKDIHKRLVLFGTLCMLPSVISRFPGIESNLEILIIFDAALALVVVADLIFKRRLHPATLWGGLLVLGGINATFAVVVTRWWVELGTRLVS
jgi:hypothetical protein